MTKQERIQAGIKALTQPKSHYDSAAILLGKVKSVDGLLACDVEVDGLLYHNVQLQAIQAGDSKSVVIVPKVGTMCLIGSIEHGDSYVMLNCNEADKVEADIQGGRLLVGVQGISYDKGSLSIAMREDGIELKVGSNSLGRLIDELISAITKLTVTCSSPGSPSYPPVNLAEFITIQTKFKMLLK